MARLVTIKEAAEALGCSKQNIHQAITRHNIPTSTKGILKRTIVERYVKIKHVDLDLLEEIRKGDK